eukprot:scaffold62053_cov32-Tisochrysis_lutea.AAC.1
MTLMLLVYYPPQGIRRQRTTGDPPTTPMPLAHSPDSASPLTPSNGRNTGQAPSPDLFLGSQPRQTGARRRRTKERWPDEDVLLRAVDCGVEIDLNHLLARWHPNHLVQREHLQREHSAPHCTLCGPREGCCRCRALRCAAASAGHRGRGKRGGCWHAHRHRHRCSSRHAPRCGA